MDEGKLSDRTVFIVDDDDAVRESLSLLLQTAGYRTADYSSGREFLGHIDGKEKGCVLLDSLMPGAGGLDILKRVRTVRPDLPVIMITGGNGAGTAEDAIRAGATDYLEKPVLEDALYERIEKAFLLIEIRDGGGASAEEVRYARHKIERLQPVEREIFDMLVIGKSDGFITSSLAISRLDVINHRDAIMEKMEARNLIQLMRMAFLCGLPILPNNAR